MLVIRYARIQDLLIVHSADLDRFIWLCNIHLLQFKLLIYIPNYL